METLKSLNTLTLKYKFLKIVPKWSTLVNKILSTTNFSGLKRMVYHSILEQENENSATIFLFLFFWKDLFELNISEFNRPPKNGNWFMRFPKIRVPS